MYMCNVCIHVCMYAYMSVCVCVCARARNCSVMLRCEYFSYVLTLILNTSSALSPQSRQDKTLFARVVAQRHRRNVCIYIIIVI